VTVHAAEPQPEQRPFWQVGADGGSHGGTVTLQPWLENWTHCVWFALSCAAFSAAAASFRIARVHASKHEALSATVVQSLAWVHDRLASITALTSFSAALARSAHDEPLVPLSALAAVPVPDEEEVVLPPHAVTTPMTPVTARTTTTVRDVRIADEPTALTRLLSCAFLAFVAFFSRSCRAAPCT